MSNVIKDSYRTMWRVAQAMGNNVWYQDLCTGKKFMIGGCYDASGTIYIHRDNVPLYYQFPDTSIEGTLLIAEMGVLAHEMGHALNREQNDCRWLRYYTASALWYTLRETDVDMARDALTDEQKLLILGEEQLAEKHGAVIMAQFFPIGLEYFHVRAKRNLTVVEGMLWPEDGTK